MPPDGEHHSFLCLQRVDLHCSSSCVLRVYSDTASPDTASHKIQCSLWPIKPSSASYHKLNLPTSLSSTLLLSCPSVFWQATSIRLVCYKQQANNNMTHSEVEKDALLNLTDRLTIFDCCYGSNREMVTENSTLKRKSF